MVWVVKRAHRRYGVFVACPRKVTIAGHPILYHFAEPKKKKNPHAITREFNNPFDHEYFLIKLLPLTFKILCSWIILCHN